MTDILSRLTNKEELLRLLAATASDGVRTIDAVAMAAALMQRVRGQDHVINDLARLIKLQWAKQQRRRPIASLLFLGPTGTGKTELAKAIAEYLYRDERALLRLDGAEFKGDHATTTLVGAAGAFQNSELGGRLTRPMLTNPRRVVLVDEVEKASSGVVDLFLQVMGDGRLTEQFRGDVADFTQSIVIFTCNAEADPVSRLQADIADYHDRLNAIKTHLAATGVFRPEIVGRFDRVYVFKPLDGLVMAEIAALKLAQAAREYGLELAYVDPQLILRATELGRKLKTFGVRPLEDVIASMFGESFVSAVDAGAHRVRLERDAEGHLSITQAEEV